MSETKLPFFDVQDARLVVTETLNAFKAHEASVRSAELADRLRDACDEIERLRGMQQSKDLPTDEAIEAEAKQRTAEAKRHPSFREGFALGAMWVVDELRYGTQQAKGDTQL